MTWKHNRMYLLWECEGDGDISVQLLCPALITVGGGGNDRRSHARVRSEKTKIRCGGHVTKITLYGSYLTTHTAHNNILIWEKEKGEVSEKD